ncbi:MAG: hypothetical protein ABII88_05865 [Candidatus Omnitrophota bacterium]
MEINNAKLDLLKKVGFLKAKQEDFFTLRTRMPAGNYTAEQLIKLGELARKYGKGFVHLTVRQGIEIPFINALDIDAVGKELDDSGVQRGTSGPRLRATTCCPGNSWCKRGMIDTFSFFDAVEKFGIRCAMDLPHKFKIAIAGCSNMCTRGQSSEVGIFGAADIQRNQIGYGVYVGGCGGRNPRLGIRLKRIFNEEEVLSLIEKIVAYYKYNARAKQRLGALIEEAGEEKLLESIGEEKA